MSTESTTIFTPNFIDWPNSTTFSLVESTTTITGPINNTSVGVTTPAAGSFTTLVANGGLDTTVIGGVTPAAGSFTTLAASSGLSLGSQVGSAPSDLSKHLNLYGGQVGFSVTSGRLNYETPSGAIHAFQVNAADVVAIDSGGFEGPIGAGVPASGAFTTFGANSATPSAKITITGSRGSATATVLESLLQALHTFGLITDSTTS